MFINLTPHELNLFDEEGEELVKTLESSGEIARVAVVNRKIGEDSLVPLFITEYGEVEDLPEPQEGVIYIVSFLVRQAASHRRDLASPGDLLRDSEGRPIGCKGLSVNR